MDKRRVLPLLKKGMIVTHDLAMTLAALVGAFWLRFDGAFLIDREALLWRIAPLIAVAAGLIYWFFDLYRSKWRFASIPDLANIVKAVSVVTLGLLVLDYVLVAPYAFGGFFFGKTTLALYWVLQIFLLGGPRLAYRAFKDGRTRKAAGRETAIPALVAGRAAEAELVLRALEAGGARRFRAVAILSPRSQDHGQWIRNVPVLGGLEMFERLATDAAERGAPIRRLIVTPTAFSGDAPPDAILSAARRHGVALSRLAALEEGVAAATLAPVNIEDLLLRPTVEIDRARLEAFIHGARIAVTGGGGSIGSEICARALAFGAAKVLVLENSEPALHQALESLATLAPDGRVEGAIADVRDAPRCAATLDAFRPDVVFHAAALKHVPYLERDWTEGVKTNVFGTLNAAEASIAAGARAFVLISTDKAIEPVSMLGATKRMAEMVAQALDAESAASGRATRLIAVRFGNVLGSNGSVVPKFRAQIDRGGPVTVTHPDMVRYFMTVREAADLVMTAGSHAAGEAALRSGAEDHHERPSVYVLKMGQPVRIAELAERMIRLAGFEPGVDVEIAYTGVRPGERLNEILFGREEPAVDTGIDGVMAAKPFFADRARLQGWLARLGAAVEVNDRAAAERVFSEAIPEHGVSVPTPLPAVPAPRARPRVVASRGS